MVVVIRYEGPKGGPGMPEMLTPTRYVKCVNMLMWGNEYSSRLCSFGWDVGIEGLGDSVH